MDGSSNGPQYFISEEQENNEDGFVEIYSDIPTDASETDDQSNKRNLAYIDCEQQLDCFSCSGGSQGLCEWKDNKCTGVLNAQTHKFWFEGYLKCPEPLDLCQTVSQNATFFEFGIDFKRERKPEDFTPKQYFCKFEMDLDMDIPWQLDVYRYLSLINTETI